MSHFSCILLGDEEKKNVLPLAVYIWLVFLSKGIYGFGLSLSPLYLSFYRKTLHLTKWNRCSQFSRESINRREGIVMFQWQHITEINCWFFWSPGFFLFLTKSLLHLRSKSTFCLSKRKYLGAFNWIGAHLRFLHLCSNLFLLFIFFWQ